jgi:hypothetical protein
LRAGRGDGSAASDLDDQGRRTPGYWAANPGQRGSEKSSFYPLDGRGNVSKISCFAHMWRLEAVRVKTGVVWLEADFTCPVGIGLYLPMRRPNVGRCRTWIGRVRHELSAVKAGPHTVFDNLVVARVASCILNESRVDRFFGVTLGELDERPSWTEARGVEPGKCSEGN